jgi:uncharacterized protein
MRPGPIADSEAVGFLSQLGLPGVIDIHVHFLPPSVMAKVWAYFDRAPEEMNVSWPINYRSDDAKRVAVLRGLGVRRFSTLAYAHRPGMARWLNDWTLAFARTVPEAIPSATFFPEQGCADDVADALAAGAEIFKIHLQVGDFDPREPVLRSAWGLLAEAGVPVVVHAGSGPAPGGFTGSGPMAEVLAAHPGLPAVFAHAGGPEYADFMALAEAYPNVGLDTTMVGTDFMEPQMPYPPELLPRLRELGLAGRVYFGSDFPNIPYQWVQQVEALCRWDLGDQWLRAVLWGNAARRWRVAPPS